MAYLHSPSYQTSSFVEFRIVKFYSYHRYFNNSIDINLSKLNKPFIRINFRSMKLNVIFTSSIKAFIDSIDKRASQVDVSVNRKVILRKKFANISNLISERYFFRKVMPLSWATSAFCFVKNLLLKFYRNLSYLSNRSLPCFFVKIFLSNLRNTESKKFTVFCLFCQNIVLFEKPRFF